VQVGLLANAAGIQIFLELMEKPVEHAVHVISPKGLVGSTRAQPVHPTGQSAHFAIWACELGSLVTAKN
jgi:hypothetical protein